MSVVSYTAIQRLLSERLLFPCSQHWWEARQMQKRNERYYIYVYLASVRVATPFPDRFQPVTQGVRLFRKYIQKNTN